MLAYPEDERVVDNICTLRRQLLVSQKEAAVIRGYSNLLVNYSETLYQKAKWFGELTESRGRNEDTH